jgi:hypothetical protein
LLPSSTMVPKLRERWSEWHSDDVYDSEDEPPARINRFGLIRAGENRSALIVVVGVLVGVLALAAVLGYVVFNALTSTDRTTVGLSGQDRQICMVRSVVDL